MGDLSFHVNLMVPVPNVLLCITTALLNTEYSLLLKQIQISPLSTRP